MTSRHLATAMNALHQAAAPAAATIGASAGSEMLDMPKAEHDAARAAERKAGAAEERARIGAILNHEAATGRGKLAAHLAFKTSMGADDAGEMLAASATEGAATGAAGASAELFSWGDIVAAQNARNSSHQGGTR